MDRGFRARRALLQIVLNDVTVAIWDAGHSLLAPILVDAKGALVEVTCGDALDFAGNFLLALPSFTGGALQLPRYVPHLRRRDQVCARNGTKDPGVNGVNYTPLPSRTRRRPQQLRGGASLPWETSA